MTHPRLHAFLSILSVVLAGTVALVLAFIHPGWAIRLVRYTSRSMVGDRCIQSARRPKRPVGRRSPAPKRSTPNALPDHQETNENNTPRAVGPVQCDPMRGGMVGEGWGYKRQKQSNMLQVPSPVGEVQPDYRAEVRSALVNLGMRGPAAGRLAKQAVRGRDFDGALRWAISNRRVA